MLEASEDQFLLGAINGKILDTVSFARAWRHALPDALFGVVVFDHRPHTFLNNSCLSIILKNISLLNLSIKLTNISLVSCN